MRCPICSSCCSRANAGASDAAKGFRSAIDVDAGDLGRRFAARANNAAATPGAATASSVPPFGQGIMAALISLQGQQTGGSGASPSRNSSPSSTPTATEKSASRNSKPRRPRPGRQDVADAVFAKIDGDGDGSVSQSELTKADHGGHHHHHRVGGGGGQGGGNPLDALMSSTGADGATTQTTTNADGSTTTTISYADGTKIDMTTPAAVRPPAERRAAARSTGERAICWSS